MLNVLPHVACVNMLPDACALHSQAACHAMPCHAAPRHAMPCHAILRPTMPPTHPVVALCPAAQAYIPKKLEEVVNYERDHARLTSGKDTGAGCAHACVNAAQSAPALCPAVSRVCWLRMLSACACIGFCRGCMRWAWNGCVHPGPASHATHPSCAIVCAEGIYYQALAGMKQDMSGARTPNQAQQVQQAQQQPSAGAAAAAAAAGVSSQQPPAGQQAAAGALPAEQQQQQQQQGEAVEAAAVSGADDSSDAPEAAAGEEDGGGGGGGPKKKRVTFADEQSGSEEGSGSESEWEDRPKMSKEEIREARKAHKKEVKEANAERRKQKLPKHVKKRATKAGKKK